MIADFYRYILESLRLKDKDMTLTENANVYYEKAKNCSDELQSFDWTWLGTYLNYTVFLYEFKNEKEKAV